ncbi:MAG: hypothetical protein LPK45_02975, partial [Bacteroidota bacterium]|nr:hypothetical protein [Bacteroidota bacterium]
MVQNTLALTENENCEEAYEYWSSFDEITIPSVVQEFVSLNLGSYCSEDGFDDLRSNQLGDSLGNAWQIQFPESYTQLGIAFYHLQFRLGLYYLIPESEQIQRLNALQACESLEKLFLEDYPNSQLLVETLFARFYDDMYDEELASS